MNHGSSHCLPSSLSSTFTCSLETLHKVQIKVMDLVSEAHFPAHLPPPWLISGADVTLSWLHKGIQKKESTELKGVKRVFFKFIGI